MTHTLSPSIRKPRRAILRYLAGFLGLSFLLFLGLVAIPRFWTARQSSIDCQCIGHLKRIHGAKEQWALEFKRPPETVPTDADLFGPGKSLESKPICPNKGTYQLGMISEPPTCTVPRHIL